MPRLVVRPALLARMGWRLELCREPVAWDLHGRWERRRGISATVRACGRACAASWTRCRVRPSSESRVVAVGCRWNLALETGGVLVWKIGGPGRSTAAMPTYLYCGVIAVLLMMHIKYEGYGLWPVSESHGGGCTPPLEHTRSITKGEALAPACKASRSGSPHRTVFALECRAHEGGHPALPYLREIPYQHPPRSQCGRNTCLVLRMYTDELGGSPCVAAGLSAGPMAASHPP